MQLVYAVLSCKLPACVGLVMAALIRCVIPNGIQPRKKKEVITRSEKQKSSQLQTEAELSKQHDSLGIFPA